MVATFLSHWSLASRPSIDSWSLATVILCCFLLGPIAAVFLAALGDSGGMWEHLVETVLATYVITLLLMGGVGCLAIVFGVSSAWVISRYNFAGRGVLEWMLLLPAAIPAYIIAYCYTDFLNMLVQRNRCSGHLDWQNPRDYFPEIRSVGGAVLVMASVCILIFTW